MSETEILTIDVASELRKLAHGPLEGPWQVPAELARFCLAAGARSVDVQLSPVELTVWAEGCTLEQEVLGAINILLDGKRAPEERHGALLRLEARGAAGLLSLLALDTSGVSIKIESRGMRFAIRARLDVPRAAEWLRAVARFAPVPVRLAGRRLSMGFGPSLARIPLRPPLAGSIALSCEADTARVWLLLHGMVAAHMTLPGQPPFLATIEMSPVKDADSSAAALREAIAPHLTELVLQAVDTALEIVPGLADRTEDEQRLLRRMLLLAARRSWRTARVLAAPAFPALGAPGRPVSLLDLGANRRGDTVWALPPGASAADFVLPREAVFLFTEEERGLIRELLGVSFRTPPRSPSPPRLAWLRESLAAAISKMRDRWAALARPRPLGESALSTEERGLLAALRRSADVALCEGAGRPHLVAGRWRVPRHGPIARAAAKLIAADDTWSYPVALALLGGRALPAPETAATWRARARDGAASTVPVASQDRTWPGQESC
jgi:hypothetical protein